MSRPVTCLPLSKTDGQWILTQLDDDRIMIKLYNDSLGNKTTYWIEGNLGYLSVKRESPE